MNKKILFLSHQADFIYGGEICTLAFMRELRARGVEVHFASPEGPYAQRAREFAIVHTISSQQFSRRVHLLPRLLPALIKTHKELRHLAKENKIDIIHATSLKAMVYCWRIGRRWPVIWHHHDILPLRFRNNIWIRTLAKKCAAILTPSHATREALIQAGVNKDTVQVLHNGFLVSDWSPRAPRTHRFPFVVGLIGEISARKGYDFLPQIIQELQKLGLRHDQVQFRAIGEGLSDPSFAEQIKNQLIATKWVKFLGRREDIKEQLQSIDLLLVPSRQDPLPTVIVEAHLSAVPAVGRMVGGIPEMIVSGENGFLADSPAEMAHRIRDCIDENLWQKLSLNARALAVQKYSIELLTEQLLRIYERVGHGG